MAKLPAAAHVRHKLFLFLLMKQYTYNVFCYNSPNTIRLVRELVDRLDLKSRDRKGRESSNLSWPIILTVFETVLTKY